MGEMEMAEKLDLGRLAKLAGVHRKEGTPFVSVMPDEIDSLIARIRELESASQPGPSDKPVAFWNPAVDHDSAAFSYGQGGGYDVPLYTRPQPVQAEYMLQILEAAGHITPELIAKARELARLALAAPSAGNGGAENT